MSFQYPTVTSRTLDPNGKSLKTIVAMHDRQITDADINLLQDLQTHKLAKFIDDHGVTSGCLTYKPLQFNTGNPNTFFVPEFDVLFNKEVVAIHGQYSTDTTLSRVQIPTPPALVTGQEDARIYIVYLEIWYQALNPITGAGYYQDPLDPGPKYYYPYGCRLPDPANAKIMPDDSVDPFQGLFTTERAQIQWRINVQRVALDYDFTQGQFGFAYDGARVPDNTYITNNGTSGDPGQLIYAQASLTNVTPGVSPLVGLDTYKFTSMGSVNGDTGLWRAGDGNVNNSLGTMDGYSYAMPIAIVFQRNTGNFDLQTNIFGCADANTAGSGTLATRVSSRYDQKLADSIYPADVVDTRSSVSVIGYDMDDQMRKGFTDLITGNTQLAIGGDPANKIALGSRLPYYVTMGPSQPVNSNLIGSWDGFVNGFSTDTRTYYTTVRRTTNDKLNPATRGSSWAQGDQFSIQLLQTSNATITSVIVTALVTTDPVNNIKSTALLLPSTTNATGQIQIQGLGSKQVVVTIAADLTGTAFYPGANALYVTVGVTYPAGKQITSSKMKVPNSIQGGVLYDDNSQKTLPVFGISEYAISAPQTALEAFFVQAINPEYSDIVIGTKIWITQPGSAGTVQTSNNVSQTTFVFSTTGLNGNLNGLYVTRAWDFQSGSYYNINSRLMSSLPNNGGIQHICVLDGAIDPNSTVIFSFLAQDTAQLAYNAPVKGAVQIEETVLFGNYTGDSNFPVDQKRIFVESVNYNSTTDANTIVLGSDQCIIKGISGDDTKRLIWVLDSSGNLVAQSVTSVNSTNGTLTITVPGNNGSIVLAGANAQPFLFCGSILPAFGTNSKLTMELEYIPYQGEGVINRDYEILHSEDNALITTNGTGAAPIIGLADVYPYNRELPITTMLPSQPDWLDETLANDPVATFFDSNYVAMRQNNVEHTFNAPLHTNDFIPPINKDLRKTVRFISAGGRGFTQATPHLGFAIDPPTPRTVLGQNLQSTQASILLYVDNVNGSDDNTGLTLTSAKRTISSAVQELPPVLRHPCTVILRNTNAPYQLTQLQSSLEVIALGDGDIRATKQYALSNLSRVIQDEGRLVISREPAATSTVVIDATGFAGFGDGPTSAFYIENSRVILNGLEFKGFTNPAITAYSSDIDFVDCVWTNNVQAGAYVGCDSVILDRGSTAIPLSGTGHVLSQSNLTSSGHGLVVNGAAAGAFYVGTRNSTMALKQHSTGSLDETSVAATTVVVDAQLNSSVTVDATFQTNGSANLGTNSVLLRTVSVEPFVGGVVSDASSNVITQVG